MTGSGRVAGTSKLRTVAAVRTYVAAGYTMIEVITVMLVLAILAGFVAAGALQLVGNQESDRAAVVADAVGAFEDTHVQRFGVYTDDAATVSSQVTGVSVVSETVAFPGQVALDVSSDGRRVLILTGAAGDCTWQLLSAPGEPTRPHDGTFAATPDRTCTLTDAVADVRSDGVSWP